VVEAAAPRIGRGNHEREAAREGFQSHPAIGSSADVRRHEQQMLADVAAQREQSEALAREFRKGAAQAPADADEIERKTGPRPR
jgi:hypothetical protein